MGHSCYVIIFLNQLRVKTAIIHGSSMLSCDLTCDPPSWEIYISGGLLPICSPQGKLNSTSPDPHSYDLLFYLKMLNQSTFLSYSIGKRIVPLRQLLAKKCYIVELVFLNFNKHIPIIFFLIKFFIRDLVRLVYVTKGAWFSHAHTEAYKNIALILMMYGISRWLIYIQVEKIWSDKQ